MAITEKEAQDIKKQLLDQIANVPEESREAVKKQIESMSNEELEEFLRKNQQIDEKEKDACVFCAIVQGRTPSMKIDENDEAIAILDINPIEKGHTLVIPKKHNTEPTEKSQELAFAVGKRILEKLKPKDITTRPMKIGDHTILNVIPLFEDTNLEKRKKITKKEHEEVAKKISAFKSEEKEPTIEETTVGEIEQPKVLPENPACMFCAIAQKKSPAAIIDENKDNIAILEINPVAKGHTLIIPKNHKETTDIPANAFTLAKKIAKKIKTKYKANDVNINPTSINNHGIIEVIPLYDGTNVTKREKISEQELISVQQDLQVKRKAATTVKKKAVKKDDKKQTKKKGSFILPKRPKYPDLPQYGSRIP